MKRSQRLLAKNKEEKINKIYREIYLNSLKSGRFLSVILCHSFSFDVWRRFVQFFTCIVHLKWPCLIYLSSSWTREPNKYACATFDNIQMTRPKNKIKSTAKKKFSIVNMTFNIWKLDEIFNGFNGWFNSIHENFQPKKSFF